MIANTAMARFQGNRSYAELHRWSIDQPEQFWRAVWEFTDVIGEPGDVVVRDFDRMPGAKWFPQASLNFAENLLERGDDHDEAIVFRAEDHVRRRSLTRAELRAEVARVASGLRPSDRVAAWMPNMPETIIAMLAAASVGATFTSCSPDFGIQGVVDRFGQVEPTVLLFAEGYWYDGKRFDCVERAREIVQRLPSLREVLAVGEESGGFRNWRDFGSAGAPLSFARLPFDHPLYVLYSSGTTGVPKCIVHGAGGTLLQHLKEHQLHCDVHSGDRLFYFTTCGWMMWNWLASGLASGATLLLYDGSPFHNGGRTLFEFLESERVTQFGTSAKFLDALAKSGLRPVEHWPLQELRMVLSTGSPLAPEGFDFVWRDVKPGVHLASISGGTDIVSCFVLGNPELPVHRGEIQCKGLGMAVEIFDAPEAGAAGELVCTRPFPSMPLGFWNDPDGVAYRAAYFERYPGVWHHGDYAAETEHGGFIIYGRSDATLNPGGVRIGTAEIYRQVEKLPEILESIAVAQEWEGDVRVILFVKLPRALSWMRR